MVQWQTTCEGEAHLDPALGLSLSVPRGSPPADRPRHRCHRKGRRTSKRKHVHLTQPPTSKILSTEIFRVIRRNFPKLPKSRKFLKLESFGRIPEKVGKLPEKSEEVYVNPPKRHANRGRSASDSAQPAPDPRQPPTCGHLAPPPLTLRST